MMITTFSNGTKTEIEFKDLGIVPVMHNKGHYILLNISKVYESPDTAKWFDDEDVIVTFGNRFNNEEEIETFKKTKLYKSILKDCIKNSLWK